ncbi:MAG TPA: LrgB family protein [Solirubrobacteraceae bacterium]|jgi:putative effector of murein hydrolase|nr:LrgB family protein [Solirubrobacteraceae bacterium]
MTELLLPLTAAVYVAALWLRRRVHTPLLNPTLLAMASLGGVVLVTGVRYGSYAQATRPLSALLTPAVVALAVPVHREREILRRFARPMLLGAAAGAVTGFAVGWAAARLLDLAPAWSVAAVSRSATSPIAIALAGELHGQAALSATLSIITGVFGATLGPAWLNALRVRHPIARGLAHGIASHGVGTGRMVEESRRAGAASAVGMALGGTVLAVALPLIWS